MDEIAYVDLDELSSIEGFDEGTAGELQERAREYLARIEGEQDAERKALGVEDSLKEIAGKAAQDEEDTGAGERPAVRVQEQLLPVAAVEVRPTAREVAAEGFRCLPPDRHDPFLAALAEAADEPVLEIDGLPVERDRLADAQAGSVEELTEGAVA